MTWEFIFQCHIFLSYTVHGVQRRQWHPLQCSRLENPMDRGAWWAAVHGVAKSWTWLSDFAFTFHFHALEKEMAAHSRVLAWRVPGTGEPGGLPSTGSHRVGHGWSDLAAAAAVHGFSRREYWSGLPFPPPMDHVSKQHKKQLRQSYDIKLHVLKISCDYY